MMHAFVVLLAAATEITGGQGWRIAVGIAGTLALFALASRIRSKTQAQAADKDGRPIYSYRGGAAPDLPEDPWTFLSLEKIDRAVFWFRHEEGVKGQDEAIEILRDELYMARARLSGAESGISSRPKMVLFFCGPTGVGKTITAQKLAKFLFGTEKRFFRIDMSEFKEEHTVHKLVGAPPSYVGYNQGGMLTNAVKATPHLVVLIDEVEKAHPKVLDIFLQILDHGVLTDGRGHPVSFGETAVIFTSNLGTRTEDFRGRPISEREQLEALMSIADLSMRRVAIREHFIRTVERFFTHEISRPEMLSRIGDNIVPFNFVDNAEVQKEVVRSILERLKQQIEETYAKTGQKIEFDEALAAYIVAKDSEAINELGARRITQAVRQEVLRRLAPALLRAEQAGRSHRLFRIAPTKDGDAVEIEESER